MGLTGLIITQILLDGRRRIQTGGRPQGSVPVRVLLAAHLSGLVLVQVDTFNRFIRIDLMREVIADIDNWLAADETAIALATVIETWGSAPRRVGAKMAFTRGGAAIAGSVSGGCVEGAVVEAGDEALSTGRPRLLHFGVADETAWGVGLACGGTIEVFVQPLDPAIYAAARSWIAADERGAIVTVIRGPDILLGRQIAIGPDGAVGALGDERDEAAIALARGGGQSRRHELNADVELFVDVLRPPPALVMVGGAHIAVALAPLAKRMGYRAVVVDPRRAFGSRARFPDVDRLIQAWPDKAFVNFPLDSETAVVTLSHDPKIDDPALRAALRSDAFYVGALGSRRTNAKRRERLAAMGFDEAQLARIHAPVGLDIGADNPEEIALAIMAEIVRSYRRERAASGR
jgi:xanthine dehydrogenase accessory factor